MRKNDENINLIFEDFIDTMDTDDITQSEELVQKDEVIKPVQAYQHYVEFCLIPVSRKKHNDMLPGGVNILKNRAFPLLKRADKYITDWKPVWYAINVPDEGAWEFNDYKEYFKYIDENHDFSRRNLGGHLRIYFDVIDNITVKGALNLLKAFNEMARQIFNMTTSLNYSERYFSLDGNDKYKYGDKADTESINTRCYFSYNSRMNIKHWVKEICQEEKKSMKVLKDIIYSDVDFMNTKQSYSHTNAKFKKNMEDAILMPYKEGCLLCIIPKGKTVTVRSGNPQYDTPMEFRIDGTLIMVHNMTRDDRYRENSNWDTLQLDPDYQHNHFCCKCNYTEVPGTKSNTVIDIGDRHIKTLDILGNEIIFQSEESLKRVVELRNTDNVENINWIIEEVDSYEV